MFYSPRRSMVHNVYLVPHWIVEALHRNDLSVGDLLDFPKIKPILSMNDLLSVVALQSFGEMVVGSRDIVAGASSVFCEWMTSCAGSKEMTEWIDRNLCPFEHDVVTRASVQTRLLTKPELPAKGDKAFEVLPLQDKALAVVLYPGFFHESTGADLQFNLISTVLKQLYVYESQAVVNDSAIFRRYLGHLLRQRP